MTGQRIEIKARRGCNMRLLKHPLGELHTIVGQSRDIAECIKGAIHRRSNVQSQFRQSSHKQLAVSGIAPLHGLKFNGSLECLDRCDLREFWR